MYMDRNVRRLAAVVLLALGWASIPAPAHAQATRGTILGTVTDQSGAAMPGVTVVATETRTNVSHDTVTNETGNFTFPNISDGVYNVKAELQGFKTVVREGIRLILETADEIEVVGEGILGAEHVILGRNWLVAGPGPDGKAPQFLFTENETNTRELFGGENRTPYVKDAFHEFLIHGRTEAVNPSQVGTKAAALYQLQIPAGAALTDVVGASSTRARSAAASSSAIAKAT